MTDLYNGRIGIAGLAGSGKSTLLAVLPRVMNAPWHVTYSGDTVELVRDASTKISRGEYPDETDISNLDNYRFAIGKRAERSLLGLKQKPPIEMAVEIRDLAGERFDFESEARGSDSELYDSHLCRCQGILFLIDPMHQWIVSKAEDLALNRYWALFDDILNHLDIRQPRTDLYVAFCISKIDYFLEKDPHVFRQCVPTACVSEGSLVDYKQLQVDLQRCADSHIFQDHGNTIGRIDNFASRSGNHCYWFACSATGWMELSKDEFLGMPEEFRSRFQQIADTGILVGKKKIFPQWYLDRAGNPRICDVRRLKPQGVSEPLKWLFTEISKKKIRDVEERVATNSIERRFMKVMPNSDE